MIVEAKIYVWKGTIRKEEKNTRRRRKESKTNGDKQTCWQQKCANNKKLCIKTICGQTKFVEKEISKA